MLRKQAPLFAAAQPPQGRITVQDFALTGTEGCSKRNMPNQKQGQRGGRTAAVANSFENLDSDLLTTIITNVHHGN